MGTNVTLVCVCVWGGGARPHSAVYVSMAQPSTCSCAGISLNDVRRGPRCGSRRVSCVMCRAGVGKHVVHRMGRREDACRRDYGRFRTRGVWCCATRLCILTRWSVGLRQIVIINLLFSRIMRLVSEFEGHHSVNDREVSLFGAVFLRQCVLSVHASRARIDACARVGGRFVNTAVLVLIINSDLHQVRPALFVVVVWGGARASARAGGGDGWCAVACARVAPRKRQLFILGVQRRLVRVFVLMFVVGYRVDVCDSRVPGISAWDPPLFSRWQSQLYPRMLFRSHDGCLHCAAEVATK